MTKQERREQQIKDLKNFKKERRSREFVSKVIDKMTHRAKHSSNEKDRNNYRQKEVKLIAYELTVNNRHDFPDAFVNEIIDYQFTNLFFSLIKKIIMYQSLVKECRSDITILKQWSMIL